MASAQKVNLAEKLALFDECWSPKTVMELNGQHVKLVAPPRRGGRVVLRLDGSVQDGLSGVRDVWLEEGEMIVVPRGVEHRPVAEEEACVMLFEPATTLNTGNVRNELTTEAERI